MKNIIIFIIINLCVLSSLLAQNDSINKIDLCVINTNISISENTKIIMPHKKNNFSLDYLKFVLISKNGKYALCKSHEARRVMDIDNLASLIDLRDGSVIFEFNYENLSHYIFTDDETNLYIVDNRIAKKIDIETKTISNIIDFSTSIFNDFNYCSLNIHDSLLYLTVAMNNIIDIKAKLISYNSLTYEIKSEDINFKFQNNIVEHFNSINGTIKEKFFKLNLINTAINDIIIKPISIEKNEFLVIDYPKLYIFRNSRFDFNSEIKINNNSFDLQQDRDYYYRNDNDFKQLKLTDDNT